MPPGRYPPAATAVVAIEDGKATGVVAGAFAVVVVNAAFATLAVEATGSEPNPVVEGGVAGIAYRSARGVATGVVAEVVEVVAAVLLAGGASAARLDAAETGPYWSVDGLTGGADAILVAAGAE